MCRDWHNLCGKEPCGVLSAPPPWFHLFSALHEANSISPSRYALPSLALTAILAPLAFLALPAASAQAATSNFDDLALGVHTALDQTHNGIGVDFISLGNDPFVGGGAGTAPLFSGHTLGVGGGALLRSRRRAAMTA